MVDARVADEDPLPPVAAFNTGAGLIALDDLILDDLFFDGLGYRRSLLPSAFENLSHRAFAQIDAVKVAHCLDDSLVAQMLRLLIEDHGRFQVRPKTAFGFQTFWQDCAIARQAVWASRKMPPRFNNDGLGRGQLRDLPALEIFRPNAGQIGQ